METLTSVVSISEFELENNEFFMDNLAILDPELWRVKSHLLDTGVNPDVLPSIIRALSKIDGGSGWGRVIIEVREHRVIKCDGVESNLVDLEIGK